VQQEVSCSSSIIIITHWSLMCAEGKCGGCKTERLSFIAFSAVNCTDNVSLPTDIQLSNFLELSANKTPCIMRWGSVTVQLQNAHTCFPISVSPSVWNGLEPTKRIFKKFYVECFYLNLWGKNSSLVKIVQKRHTFFFCKYLHTAVTTAVTGLAMYGASSDYHYFCD